MPHFTLQTKSIFYRERGEGELLLILPGNTASSAAHAPQIEFYSQFFHTVSLDFLGTGQSDRMDEWNTDWWVRGAEQVHTLIDHLGKSSAILMGTSGGAVVAVYTAQKYPDEINALVLDSFSIKFTERMLKKNVMQERSNPDDMQIQFWQYCHGEDWRQVIESDTQMIKKLVAQGGYWFNDSFQGISVPTLVTGSKNDNFLPDIETDYQMLSENIPECSVFLTDEGDHPLMFTQPELFNKEAMTFMQSL